MGELIGQRFDFEVFGFDERVFRLQQRTVAFDRMRPTQPSSLKIRNQGSLGILMRMRDGGIEQMDYAY